jgi:hypothetical protein
MKFRTDLIKPPRPADDRFFGDLKTQGIVDVVLYADSRSGGYTREFAKTLKAAKLIDTCRNIYEFVKTQIPYVLDKKGYQWIKSPGRLWQERSGDCKSFSVFIGACLKNLGIRYGYRFTSYDPGDPTPTHVYVFVPLGDGSEILLDAVWSGPFNTQKKFDYKTDYLMAKTHYLGTAGKHIPGVLKIETPINKLTDGELDLLLMKQRLEIKKMNAQRSGIGSVSHYDEAIKAIGHCIRNVDNPDFICAIGEALEEGYSLEEAISGIGKPKAEKKAAKAQKKQEKKDARAKKKEETGKTAAGRVLQKVGKGLKTAGKAVVKVATAPMRLVAKGAMEIYLPKAAPFFLYLFAPDADKLPDMMKRKRLKAEKFKKFVVKGLGMKESHFMQIISNNLEKRYGKPPAQYLAEKLMNRVSGIGNPKLRWRRQCDSALAGMGIGAVVRGRKFVKPKPCLAPKAKPGWNSTIGSPIPPPAGLLKSLPAPALLNIKPAAVPATAALVKPPDLTQVQTLVQQNAAAARHQLEAEMAMAKKAARAKSNKQLLDVGEKAASGNFISAAIGAITWLIQKITALFGGKEKMDPITAADFPDVERDAANVFDYQDLSGDYSNLTTAQKAMLKDSAAYAIEKGLNETGIMRMLEEKFPFLTAAQRNEIYGEIKSGPEALDYWEAERLARQTGSDEPHGWMADEKELEDVVIKTPKKKTDNSGLVLFSLAGLALLAMSGSRKKAS